MTRAVAHKMIADTAKGIAAAEYEELARDNVFYKLWPRQKDFVKHKWSFYIVPARATLAQMLQGNYSEELKEQIEDALKKDYSLSNREGLSVVRS